MEAPKIKKVLEKACKKAGGQKAWANQNGVSAAYVSDVLAGKRDLGEKILKALGYKSTVFYQKVKP